MCLQCPKHTHSDINRKWLKGHMPFKVTWVCLCSHCFCSDDCCNQHTDVVFRCSLYSAGCCSPDHLCFCVWVFLCGRFWPPLALLGTITLFSLYISLNFFFFSKLQIKIIEVCFARKYFFIIFYYTFLFSLQNITCWHFFVINCNIY